MATHITAVKGREILDSRGNPTLEVEMTLSDGSVGRSMVPSGASTGEHEALELRDKDPKRFLGKGVLKAVHNVDNQINALLKGKNISDLRTLDKVMLEADGTQQKANLGGNSLLGVSLAFANASATSQKRPLYRVLNEWMGLSEKDIKMPVPLMNILNGGQHANNGLEIQEFMVVPHGFSKFSEALRAGTEVFHHLKKILSGKELSTAVGDEGGFAPALKNNDEALVLICEAVKEAGYELGKEIALALDVAASSFYTKERAGYWFAQAGREVIGAADLMNYYGGLLDKFPLVSIEDGLDENDWAGWAELTKRFGKRVQLVGDDLFCTQVDKVKKGMELQAANAVLIKVNQVGTLSETFDTMLLCRQKGYGSIASHRSGETEDTFIAHLAVASGCGQIKTGSASRSERIAKYNELMRIEQTAQSIPFVGWQR